MKSYKIKRYVNQILSCKPEKEMRMDAAEMINFYSYRHELLLTFLQETSKGMMSCSVENVDRYQALLYKISNGISRTIWQINRYANLFYREENIL